MQSEFWLLVNNRRLYAQLFATTVMRPTLTTFFHAMVDTQVGT